MARRSPESAAPFIPPTEEAAAVPPPEAEEVIELRKVKKPKKLTPEQEARFKEGLSKLREREEKRKEEEKIIEETRAALKQRYETREKIAKTEAEDELMMKATDEFREKMKARAKPPEVQPEAVPEEALEEPEILGEISEEEAQKIEAARARRYQQEIRDDLKLMQIEAEWSDIQKAATEDAEARGRAKKILGKDQAAELDNDPVARTFFAAGESPIILAGREAMQKEIDGAAEAQGYAISFDDMDQTMRDLRSVQEGGKVAPAEIQIAEERTRANFTFGSELRKSRLEAIDQAHQEFPESFDFTAKEYERLVEKAALLRNRVERAKKERPFFAKVRGLFEGPTVDERELRALTKMLDDWEKKIEDFVDAGKSKLAAGYLSGKKAELANLERQASKFLTR